MALYRRILVPLGELGDAAILEHVTKLAKLTGAEIILLRVAHYRTRDMKAAEIAESEALLDQVAARLAARGVAVRTVVGQGEIAATILAQAKELQCDLIALATHGHNPLTCGVLGCVSEGVRRASPIPVLMLRVASAADR